MKKLLLTVLILTLSLAVLLIFTGCNKENKPLEPEDVDLDAMDSAERAKFLFEASDRRLSAASSYAQKDRMTFVVEGISKSEIVGEGKIEGVGTDNYKEHSVTTATTWYDTGAEKTVETSISGYADGYMYKSWQSSDYSNEIKSPLTAAEYLEHKRASLELPDPKPETYKSEKNKDGTWTLAIHDFDKEFMEAFAEQMGLSGAMMRGEIDEISLMVDLDENFYPKRMIVDFDLDFDLGFEVKMTSMEVEIFNINSTTVNAPSLADYRELSDLRAMDNASSAISALGRKDEGSFVYEMSLLSGNSSSYKEYTDRRTVEYETKLNDTLRVTMDVKSTDGNSYYIYEYGYMSKYLGKDGALQETNVLTNDDVKDMLYQMQCFAAFDEKYISKIEYNETAKEYVLTFRLTDALIAEYTGKDLSDLESDALYTVTVAYGDDGEISSCSMRMSMKFKYIYVDVMISCEQKELNKE